jgi:hypothetical protein
MIKRAGRPRRGFRSRAMSLHCAPVLMCIMQAPALKRRLSLFAHVPLRADIASQTLLTNPPASGAPALRASTPARSMAGVA